MARNKEHEALVFVLDVGPSMGEVVAGETKSYFENSITCIKWVLQRKLFSASKDTMALVLFGTPDTENELANGKGDEYQNIIEAKPMLQANWDFLRYVSEEVQLSSTSADFLDALVVALNVLVNEANDKTVTSRKIVFFSNFGGGCCSDQLNTIINGVTKLNIEINLIGPDLEESNSNSKTSASRQHAEDIMKKILEKTNGNNYTFADAIPQLMIYKTKEVRSMPWNVDLDIGPNLKIPVSSYVKIREAKPPPFKSCYARDETTPWSTETSYHKNDEAQTEVLEKETVRAFRYGSTLVPFSEEDMANMKYKGSAKCLSVLGFTKKENIKVHYYSGFGSRVVVGRRNCKESAVALSAFIHALYETNTVAIVRYCYSNNSGPRMGFLSPLIKKKYEALVLIILPFVEDIRRFVFPSLNTKFNKCTEEQLEVMDDFITKMSLCSDEDDEQELLKSNAVVNPNIQRLYQCVSHRAFNENKILPEIEPQILNKLEPPAEITNAAKPEIEKLKNLFPLKVVEKRKKEAGAELFETASAEAKDGEASTSKPRLYDSLNESIADIVQGPVTAIGTVRPVPNFHLLLKKSGSAPEKVCKEMQSITVQIVSESFGNQFYSKALECLKALRIESVKAAVEQFNEFLKEIKNNFNSNERKNFWQMIQNEKISLISKDETASSNVSAEESKMFLEEKEEVTEEPDDAMDEDADDLLAMM